MKKLNIILIATASMFLSHHVNGQNREHLKLGPKTGVNLSNVYKESGDDFVAEAKFGYVLGGFISIPINALIGIQPEVLYSQKGFKSTGQILGENYSLIRTTNHIDIPIQLAIKPSNALTLLIGPQYSYTISKKDKNSFGTLSQEKEESFDNDIRKNVLGLVGGVDVNIQNIVLSGRAGWDIQKNNADGSSSDIQYKNFWYQLTIGINLINKEK